MGAQIANPTFKTLKAPDNIPPATAEDLTLHFYTTQLTKDSAWIPGLQVDDIEVMRCPSCNAVNHVIKHKQAKVCTCGLKMFAMGNMLRIWK